MIESIRCGRLIGRVEETAFLRECAKQARLGHGSLVIISGDPGIGKSRLVDETIVRAKALAMHYAKSFCLEHARSPLGPLADIVRSLHAADPSVLTVARNVRRVLARLVPEIDNDVPADGEAQGARSQYAAIAEMFRRYGERHPAVLVIEDAHWSDVSTAEFLKHFAARVGDSHLLLIVAMRAHATSAISIPSALAELRRHSAARVLELEALTPAEMQAFLRIAAGGRTLRHDSERKLSQLADGNPLFAEELLASTFAANGGQRGLPASIREIFLERVVRLDSDDRDILIEAAVVGQRFDAAFLAELTKRPLERILLALRHARSLQLVVEDGDEGVVFRHPLVRETLYQSILVAEARAIHRRIVRQLETLPDRRRRIAALAYHSWAAGETQTALAYNELAGDEAMAQLAPDEASACYERALACAPDNEARHADLQRKLGEAYSDSGWSTRAVDMYESAYDHARRAGKLESMAGICFAIGREYGARAEGDAAMRWLTAGLETVASIPDDGTAAFSAHAGAAVAHAWRGEPDIAQHYIALAEGFNGSRPPASAQDLLDAKAAVDILSARSAVAVTRYRDACAGSVVAGTIGIAVRVRSNFADQARLVGELELARRVSDEAVRLADEVVLPRYRPYVLTDSGIYNASAGFLDLARRRLAQAENAAAGFDSPRLHGHLVHLGLLLARTLGDPLLDERYSDERAIDEAFSSREPWWIGRIAQLFADRFGRIGRNDDAARLTHRALTVMPTIVYAHELAITAATYGRQTDFALAREKLTWWARVAKPDYGAAFVDLFDAHVAHRSNRSPVQIANRAALRFKALGLPLWAAESFELAGERASAVQIYLSIGCAGDISRSSGSRPVDIDAAALTKREREVLFFVADGRSNREIADELSLSERTVESHIRAILSKIGGRSRHDIIRLADVRAIR